MDLFYRIWVIWLQLIWDMNYDFTLSLPYNFMNVSVGVKDNLDVLVGLLGCRHSSLPLKFLGLPLGAKFKEVSICNPLLGKMEWRLVGWKRLYLSKGGRVTLIKSTLFSLPTYFLFILPVPGKVANRMEKLHRDFLCSGMWLDFFFFFLLTTMVIAVCNSNSLFLLL